MTGGAIRPEPVWQVEAQLGEGPAWIGHEAALRFVDIKRGQIHRFDPATGATATLDVGGNPSFIVPTEGGGLIAGSQHALYPVAETGFGPPLATIAQPGHNRTNDATVDAAGRLWIATMDDAEACATGTVWCFANGALHHAGTGAVVTNGPAVSADLRHLYHVDSGARRITRYALGDDHRLVDGEPFVQLGEDDGYPDGVVLDAEGCLWVALWDGWGLRRYAPDGELLLHFAFPCARVSKLAFGGPDLRTALVTTARVGLDAAALAAQPLAGSLFAFQAPVAGLPLPSVKLRG